MGTKEDKVHRLENVGYAVLFHPPDHREGSELDVGSPFLRVFFFSCILWFIWPPLPAQLALKVPCQTWAHGTVHTA